MIVNIIINQMKLNFLAISIILTKMNLKEIKMLYK